MQTLIIHAGETTTGDLKALGWRWMLFHCCLSPSLVNVCRDQTGGTELPVAGMGMLLLVIVPHCRLSFPFLYPRSLPLSDHFHRHIPPIKCRGERETQFRHQHATFSLTQASAIAWMDGWPCMRSRVACVHQHQQSDTQVQGIRFPFSVRFNPFLSLSTHLFKYYYVKPQ